MAIDPFSQSALGYSFAIRRVDSRVLCPFCSAQYNNHPRYILEITDEGEGIPIERYARQCDLPETIPIYPLICIGFLAKL